MTCVCFNPRFYGRHVLRRQGYKVSCYVSLFISLLRDFDEGSEKLRCYSYHGGDRRKTERQDNRAEIVERETFSFIARVRLINSKRSRESPLAHGL